ncbi:threonine/serine exporter family protein [Clostridium rectalis]|uniref:threonine/serine exporter family protein n=1 Tax=Clostridium rectalis TaxID=2040295 RepID=UPI000F6377EF|nr:threonine/serine exporter family protein [Clostridium rectalis]
MDINRILQLATLAGEIMLESGAEIYRVEETVERICHAYGVFNTDSFITPTGLVVSVTNSFGITSSKVKRIKSRTVDLDKIALVNDLSRKICSEKLTLDFIEQSLKDIKSNKTYSKKIIILASCIAAGFFTLLYGGSKKDFITSLFIGGLIQIVNLKLNSIQTNAFFINAIGGALASFIALISTSLNLADNTDKIVIGSLMLLVPGLVITNAIRDTLAGDLMAGNCRAVEAFLIAIAIAVGSGITFSLWFNYFGGVFK